MKKQQSSTPTKFQTSLTLNSLSVTLTDVPSLNKFYQGGHWIMRKKMADKYHNQIKLQLIGKDLPLFEAVRVVCNSNSRLDLDNRILAVKFTLDALKELGVIQDDSPKFVKEVVISDDKEMDKNTFIIKIQAL